VKEDTERYAAILSTAASIALPRVDACGDAKDLIVETRSRPERHIIRPGRP
jgi:hypothetical protein